MKNIIKNSILVLFLMVGMLGSTGVSSVFAAVPTIVSASATHTQTTATLSGTVSANGTTANAWFQKPDGSNVPGSGFGPFTGDNLPLPDAIITGLTPDTEYTYKLVVSDGPNISNQDIYFRTDPAPSPTIVSASATHTQTTATLSGTVSANGTTANAWFQKPDGSNVPGSGFGPFTGDNLSMPSAIITGLTAGTPYTYKLVVSDGIHIVSEDISFTTNSSGGGNGNGSTCSNLPTITSLSPTSVNEGSAATTVTVTGTNFVSGTSQAQADGSDRTTTNVTSGTPSTLTMTLTAADLASDGHIAITVTNGSNCTSNSMTFTVNNVGGGNSGGGSGGNSNGNSNDNNSNTQNENGIITTIQATSQLTTSAKLNGLFINQTGESVQGYFEYGKTSALNSSTTPISLGTGASLSFSKTITSLTPDTIYYFRAVAKRDNTTYKGNVLVFKTKKVVTPTEPTTPTTTNNNSVVVEPVEETNIASSIFTITTAEEMTEVGKEIEYTLTYQNNSAKNLNNAVITVQLPDSVNFVASDLGVAGENNTVVFNLGTLAPSQTGTMKIIAKVNEKANDQNVIVTTAIMSYTPEGSDFQKDEIAYVTNKVNPVNDLGAASIWGYKSFLPSTLLGWLAVILVALGFIIVGKNLYAAYAYKRSEKQYDDVEDVELDNIDLDNLPK